MKAVGHTRLLNSNGYHQMYCRVVNRSMCKIDLFNEDRRKKRTVSLESSSGSAIDVGDEEYVVSLHLSS